MKPKSNQETLKSRLATAVPFFAILVAPLGVAGQNIGLGVALLMFIILSVLDRGSSLKLALRDPLAKQFMILWFLLVLPITASTLARGADHDARRFFIGYVYTGFIVIAGLSLRSYEVKQRVILNTVTTVCGLMGLIALSQFIYGWKIEGTQILHQINRAQGFYSHPLTFAYVAIILMPWSFARVLAKPRQWQSWVLSLAIGLIILTSQSITVISVSAVILILLMTILLDRRRLLLALAAAFTVSTLTLTLPNPIQAKFQRVLAGQRGDHETPYPDDRIAFWHAHWEMIKDAPVTGHGTGLEAEDRKPYYDKLGLGYLKRMYEAHNMYLQAWTEGGVVALMALVAFLVWWLLRVQRDATAERWYRIAMLLTPIAFGLAGLTQNAIQDSEVRYALLLCFASFSFGAINLVPVDKFGAKIWCQSTGTKLTVRLQRFRNLKCPSKVEPC